VWSVLSEHVVFLEHEVEILLGHDARVGNAVEIVENEFHFVASETVGVECPEMITIFKYFYVINYGLFKAIKHQRARVALSGQDQMAGFRCV
jgi:hypothetical protein